MKESLVIRWNSIQQQLIEYVFSKVRNRRDAEDIVQEIFIKASSSVYQLKDDKKFSGWMFRITRNTVMDYYRSKKRHADTILRQRMNELYIIKADAYGNIMVCEDRLPCNCTELFSASFSSP